jgi:formylglycine-generating enzyme
MARKTCALLLALLSTTLSRASADTFGTGANAFQIDFVTIGAPGNAGDFTANPSLIGGVPFAYRIGKFEISEQIIEQANIEAGLAIFKDNRGPHKPATSISWFNALRFINWLNTSTGNAPAYKFDGNGSFQLWSPPDAGFDPTNRFRNSLARYFLPSLDEWFKAAYYDPASDAYYDYPTGSNLAPTPVASGTAAGTAVYEAIATGPADVMLAGGPSRYGTIGQGGNVWEWQETEFDQLNDSASSSREVRGGSYGYAFGALRATGHLLGGLPGNSAENVGFRVASIIPEPRAVNLGGCGAIGLLMRRRRAGGRYFGTLRGKQINGFALLAPSSGC